MAIDVTQPKSNGNQPKGSTKSPGRGPNPNTGGSRTPPSR